MDDRYQDRTDVMDSFAGVSGKGWIRANCRMCERKTGKADKKQSLGYDTKTGGWNCFKCGSKGRLTDAQKEQLPITETSEIEFSQTRVEEPPEFCWGYVPIFDGPGRNDAYCEPARVYYRGRGLPDDVGRTAGVGTSLFGINRGRLLIPFYDQGDPTRPWKGWVGRDFTGTLPPQFPKYRYAKGFKRATYLYNDQVLDEKTDRPVYVVEGALDALALFPDGVAVLGKPLEYHVGCLARAVRPVVVCLDGDAWEEGQALAWTLQHYGQRAGNIRLPPGKDPDEMPRDWLDREAQKCLR